MNILRALVFGACAIAAPLALGAAVDAAEPPSGALVLYDAVGRPVATLTPIQQTAASASPVWELLQQVQDPARRPAADPFAQMDAQMNAMMARMNALMGMPFPPGAGGMLDAAAMPGGGAGQVFISTFSAGGHGSCSETITYRSDGSGAQPQVAVHRVGDACGADTPPPVAADAPDAGAPPTPATKPGSRVYNIDYRHKLRTTPPVHG